MFKANNNINRLLVAAIFLKTSELNALFLFTSKGPDFDQTVLVQCVKVALTMYPPKLNFYANA